MNLAANTRCGIRAIARRCARDERAQSVIEFAVALPFLTLMAVGTFAVGMIIDRHLTMGQLVRNAGNMYARGVSFATAQTSNRQIIVDAATGLGMTISGGKSVVYFTLLTRVPATAMCDSGGSAVACANRGLIVMAQRQVVGNTTIQASKYGTPTNLDADGNHRDFFQGSDAVADTSKMPAAMTDPTTGIQENEIVYGVEAFHTPSTIAFEGIFAPDIMYSRAFF